MRFVFPASGSEKSSVLCRCPLPSRWAIDRNSSSASRSVAWNSFSALMKKVSILSARISACSFMHLTWHSASRISIGKGKSSRTSSVNFASIGLRSVRHIILAARTRCGLNSLSNSVASRRNFTWSVAGNLISNTNCRVRWRLTTIPVAWTNCPITAFHCCVFVAVIRPVDITKSSSW